MTIFAAQTTFGRGQLTRALHGRTDIDHWKMGVSQLVNFHVMRHGGIARRPGTQFMGDAAMAGRLVRFVFSRSQAYVLEFGHRQVRVWNPISGLVMLNGAPLVIPAPWDVFDVKALHFAQSADILYVHHGDYPPFTIERRGETQWSAVALQVDDGPYMKVAAGRTALRPSARGDATQLRTGQASSSGDANAGMDEDPDTEWVADGTDDEWLRADFDDGKTITGYSIRGAADTPPDGTAGNPGGRVGGFSTPRTWTFQASDTPDDESSWVVLDVQAGREGWGPQELRHFTFVNKTRYISYRLHVTERNDSVDQRQPVRISELLMTGQGDDANVTVITANNTAEINGGAGFVASDVGRHVSLFASDGYFHWCQIYAVTSPTQVSARVKGFPFPDTKTAAIWKLGAWSDTSGYPARVAFFNERLAAARTDAQPQTVWFSRTGEYTNFGTSSPLLPDDAITLSIAELGEISFLAESQELLIGTIAASRVMGAAERDGGFSATSFRSNRYTGDGHEPIQPEIIGNKALTVSKFGRCIREFALSAEQGTYVAPDITILNQDVFSAGVLQIAYAAEPDAIMWCLMGDGSLVAVTYENEQRMIAVSRHKLGGGGFVESLTTIPGVGRDELWMMVSRTVGGQTRRWIERLTRNFSGELADATYLDACERYEGPPVRQVSGLDHLVGFQVGMLSDGGPKTRLPDGVEMSEISDEGRVPTNLTLASGTVAIPDDETGRIVTVGLPYRSIVKTLRASTSKGDGALIGRKVLVQKIFVDVMDAKGLYARASYGEPVELIQRDFDDIMDEASPLHTGSTPEVAVDDTWQGGGVVEVSIIDPLPATIRSITTAYELEP